MYVKKSLERGCNADCCKHGAAYVTEDEMKKIGKDVFVEKNGDHFIGKTIDGKLRNLEKDYCPFLDKDDLCELHHLDLKPIDCRLFPIYPKKTEKGYDFYINECPCGLTNKITTEDLDEAIKLYELLDEEDQKRILNFQEKIGFNLVKLKVEE